jgi:hypothetical protein
MDLWSKLLAKIVVSVISIFQATTLRTRYYSLKNEHEIMWTSLDDIARMYKDTPAGMYAKKTLEDIDSTYGR